MKVLVINGPNLNMLGKREPHIYGNATLEDLECFIRDTFENKIDIEFFQSNHEGCIIDKLHESNDIFDGVVINPGAFTHYSYAIYDAIKSIFNFWARALPTEVFPTPINPINITLINYLP